MSDHRISQEFPVGGQIAGDADQPRIAQAITQAEIDDVMNDPDLPIEERQARLQELADRLGAREDIDGGGELTPLEAQIGEALAMLAQGGHFYGNAEVITFDGDAGSDSLGADSEDDPDRGRQ